MAQFTHTNILTTAIKLLKKAPGQLLHHLISLQEIVAAHNKIHNIQTGSCWLPVCIAREFLFAL